MEFYACWNEGVSTPQDRAALFDEVVAKIMARDAFVPIKLERLGVDVRRELLRYRDEVIAADTDEKLIYALLKLSCARKDPHVRMQLVENGLQLPGIDVHDYIPLTRDNYLTYQELLLERALNHLGI